MKCQEENQENLDTIERANEMLQTSLMKTLKVVNRRVLAFRHLRNSKPTETNYVQLQE